MTTTASTIHHAAASAHVQVSPEPAPVLKPPPDSVAFVIFGASGDLTKRKLIPALYNLAAANLLPSGFAVIGFAVTPMDDDAFRAQMREWVKNSPEATAFREEVWTPFAANLHYI